MVPPAAVHAFAFFRLVEGAAFPLLANTHVLFTILNLLGGWGVGGFAGFNVAWENPLTLARKRVRGCLNNLPMRYFSLVFFEHGFRH